MNSKYPLHPDFSDIKDSGKPKASWLLFKLGNMLLRSQEKKVKADGERVKEETVSIPGYKGAKIRVRVFSPAGSSDALPCVLNFHGGAFVGTGMPHQIKYCLHFAEELKCRVVFVDYRLALEHPFPVPVEDCYAALCWVTENAGKLNIDPKRIAVFGDSAGGALAAAVCQMARDRGVSLPCFQMLIYPVTDSSQSSESAKKYTDVPEFNAQGNKLMWKLYLKNGDFGMPEYAAPLLADNFAELPPAYVETAEFDCLHDEGIAYAEKLRQAGVAVELNETHGSYHGFDIQFDRPYSQRALEHRTEVLKKVFRSEN